MTQALQLFGRVFNVFYRPRSSLVVRRLDVRVEELGNDNLRLHLVYSLAPSDQEDGQFVLDWRHSPFTIERVGDLKDEAHNLTVAPKFITARACLFLRPRGHSWSGATLHATVRWDRDPARAQVLSIPDHLPQPMAVLGWSKQAVVSWTDEERCCRVLGVLPHPDGTKPGDALRIVIGSDPNMAVKNHSYVTFVGEFADDIAPVQRDRFDRLMGRILSLHADDMGTAVHRLVIVSTNVTDFRHGVLFPIEPDKLARACKGDPEYGILTSRAAGLWWNGGIRLNGAFAVETAAMLRGIAGLQVVRRIAPERVPLIMELHRKAANESRWQDALAILRSTIRHRWVGRKNLAILSADDRKISDAFNDLVKEHWGMHMPASHVLERLQTML